MPAKALNLAQGQLMLEGRADISIVDMDAQITLNSDELVSKGKNNPWLGQALSGKVHCTINGGRIVYQVWCNA